MTNSNPLADFYDNKPVVYTVPDRREPTYPPDIGDWEPQRFCDLTERWIKACADAWLVASGRVAPRPRLAVVRP